MGVVVAFLAGMLTLLNPCVLPVLPIVIASAATQGRAGPVALAAGLVASFAIVGMFVLTVGFSVGIDGDELRTVAAAALVVAGVVLVVPRAQAIFATVTAPVSARGSRWLQGVSGNAWHGQLAVGLLLGVVWTPCVGPTLGVAIAAASQGENLLRAASTFVSFGLGVAVSMLVVAGASQRLLFGGAARLRVVAGFGKVVLGVALLAVGALVLTGFDRVVETWALELFPDWLIRFTTRF